MQMLYSLVEKIGPQNGSNNRLNHFYVVCWRDVVELTLIAKGTGWTLQGGHTVELAAWNSVDDGREAT